VDDFINYSVTYEAPDHKYFERVEYKLDFIMRRLHQLHQKVDHMSAQTDSLSAAVVAMSASVDAAMGVIASLVARLPDPSEAAAIAQAANDLQAKAAALSAALSAVPA
jgi:Mg2+ and Co2+ transporter CorA